MKIRLILIAGLLCWTSCDENIDFENLQKFKAT